MKLLLSLSLAASVLLPVKADELLVDIRCFNNFGTRTLDVREVSVPTFVQGSPLLVVRSPDSRGSVLVNVSGYCMVIPSPQEGLGEIDDGRRKESNDPP